MGIAFIGGSPPPGVGTTFGSNWSQAIKNLNPTRWYRLTNPGSGNAEADKGSDGQNGTWHGTPVSVKGLVPFDATTATWFDASSAYLDMPTTNLPTGISAWSIGVVLYGYNPSAAGTFMVSLLGTDATAHLSAGFYGSSSTFGVILGASTGAASQNANQSPEPAGFPHFLISDGAGNVTHYAGVEKVNTLSDASLNLTYGAAHIGANNAAGVGAFANFVMQDWFLIKGTAITNKQMYALLRAFQGA